MADFALEAACGCVRVCGVDEVGRGPWAGPVVAAAVILDRDWDADGVDDSKRLTAAARTRLRREIEARAQVGTGQASVYEIDRLNILSATLLAMRRAVAALPCMPECALVDGNRLPDLPCPAQAVTRGDARSLSIAAASIVAKVERDRLMAGLAADFPGYGWERNAGYGTPEHAAALERLGVTPHHRRSFAPVARRLAGAR
ncbi:MAG: ribonuclease HII [Rhodospirillales bacterium]|nr:ribonuclease HII [Rhodospirillales bacterium]MDE0373077.1 ribonuclease HII [Rhodospirillales bacterium]MYE19865.1 ribonuclease HII [Rhodospirillales bacterium]